MEVTIESNGARLVGHLARPPSVPAPGVVLCHGFPTGPRGAAGSAATFPELADRIARHVGWFALAFTCRGTGASEGDFSGPGWLADIASAVRTLGATEGVRGVWLVGVGEGGTLALAAAANDPTVRGVAVLGAPLTLREWVRDPSRFLAFARRVGMIRTPGFPPSAPAWAREWAQLDAIASVRALAPRPVAVIVGSDDPFVAVDDARALADAAGGGAELLVIPAAGHELRHDPRAVASLLGWLDRRARDET